MDRPSASPTRVCNLLLGLKRKRVQNLEVSREPEGRDARIAVPDHHRDFLGALNLPEPHRDFVGALNPMSASAAAANGTTVAREGVQHAVAMLLPLGSSGTSSSSDSEHSRNGGQSRPVHFPRGRKPGRVMPCQDDGCLERPYFNYFGETISLYCATHKLRGMVNVTKKACREQGCTRGPSYNFPEGPRTGIYCSVHKKEGMRNVITRKCETEGCEKTPSFNFEGLKRAFCSIHKTQGMVNLGKRKCEARGCTAQPKFNFPGNRAAILCPEHRLEGMTEVVIKRRHCTAAHCPEWGSWLQVEGPKDKEGFEPIFCDDHRLQGCVMVKRV